MLSALGFLLNPYDRKARLQPALLCGLPLFTSLLLLVPDFGVLRGVVSSVVLFCGGTTLLTHLGRDRGKAHELRLFEEWGGKPSVAMLRHRDRRLATSDKRRYRAFLERRVPGLKLASQKREQQYPDQADDGYQGATSWLLAQTRDRNRFGLVYRETMNYGFRRNLLFLKPWALTFDAVAVGIIVLASIGPWRENAWKILSETTIVVCATFVIVHALIFFAAVRRNWVYTAADALARQLLTATDQLPP